MTKEEPKLGSVLIWILALSVVFVPVNQKVLASGIVVSQPSRSTPEIPNNHGNTSIRLKRLLRISEGQIVLRSRKAESLNVDIGDLRKTQSLFRNIGLSLYSPQREVGGDNPCNSNDAQNESREIFRRNQATEVGWRFVGVLVGLIGGICLFCYVDFVYVNRVNVNRAVFWSLRFGGGLLLAIGFCSGLLPIYWDYDATYGCNKQSISRTVVGHRCVSCTEELRKADPLNIPY